MEERIKEGFKKVKEDISFLSHEIDSLKLNLIELREAFTDLSNLFLKLNERNSSLLEKISSLNPSQDLILSKEMPHLGTTTDRQTDQHIIPTHFSQNKTDNVPLEAQRTYFSAISMRNEGVPTDRQTDQQTDKPTHNSLNNPSISIEKTLQKSSFPQRELEKSFQNPSKPQVLLKNLPEPIPNQNSSKDLDSIEEASKILDSLDFIKKEIRLKFKRLTDQEWLVFSTIYQFEDQSGFADYKSLAEKLNLTESSIREYVGKLIRKGIPVDKIKINNKSVHLKISQNLKKIASLSTILQLREI